VTLQLRAACSPGEVRVAVLQDGALLDFAIWRPGLPDGVGDLYMGRVRTRVPAMAGAFVALDGAEGFLPDSEGGARLHAGDAVAVRVTRAAQGGKGPRLTARLAPDELAPARGPGALLELARLHAGAPIFLDDAGMAARLRTVLGTGVTIVSRAFDETIEAEVQALSESEVAVSGGARLLIHPTPALVAIDIDAGGMTAQRQGKIAAHVEANLAVLPTLAAQIRLRNLSGAIVVDFAGLPVRRRPALASALQAALAADPLRPRLLGFTALGLAEIVRPRVHPPLHELLAGPHAAGLAALRVIATQVALPPHRLPALRRGGLGAVADWAVSHSGGAGEC
jgi:Ribonuclease G/E